MLACACALFVAACGQTGRPVRPTPGVGTKLPSPPAVDMPGREAEPAVTPIRVRNWEAFAHTSRVLDLRIAAGDSALRGGAGKANPAAVAALRMTAEARDLLERGQPEQALDLLERAIGMDGRNGFAYLYLAHLYHRQGRYEQGRVFAQRARQYLPRDAYVLGELEGLRASLAVNTNPLRGH